MDTKFEIVDRDGDPIGIEHFEEGTDIPLMLRSMRIVEGQMIITLEYLHGEAMPCKAFARIGGYYQLCNTLLNDDGCPRVHLHTDY